ncbi:MAG: cohesin domain-containing protein [bacterium JZ-2024 1]
MFPISRILCLRLLIVFFAVFLSVTEENTSETWVGPGKEGEAEGEGQKWEWENAFIRIFVNTGKEETGRFALDTTGGDPQRAEDDNQPLIYGHPFPWTSYTTIRINGRNYAFGGETRRRAGRFAEYGKMIQAPALTPEGRHTTVFAYPSIPGGEPDILVTQSLKPVLGFSTQAADTLLIQYEIENRSEQPVEVGVRIVLDTMLGSNDGAPLRVGPYAIETEKCFRGSEVPDFVQAFDSLAEARVISQATLRGEGLNPPDLVYIANWGRLADEPWEPACRDGFPLVREGEEELDSALGLYWYPVKLLPQEVRVIRTMYGLGGITVAYEGLLLGLSAPLTQRYKPKGMNAFSVMGYVENVSPIPVRLERMELGLPAGLALLEGNNEESLEEVLSPRGSRQFFWRVALDGSAFGNREISFQVHSAEYGVSRLKRTIALLPPPLLKAELEFPRELAEVSGELKDNPFRVKVRVSNPESSVVSGLKFSLQLPEGMMVPPPEKKEKFVPFLDSAETREIYWVVKTTEGLGNASGKVVVDSQEIEAIELPFTIFVPALPSRLLISPPVSKGYVGEYIFVDVKGEQMKKLASVRFTLSYDPFLLKLIRVEPGTISYRAGYHPGKFVQKEGKITFQFQVSPEALLQPSETFLRLHFRLLAPGAAKINVEEYEVVTASGLWDIPVMHGSVEITGEEGG